MSGHQLGLLLLLSLGLGPVCPSLRAQMYMTTSVALPTPGSSDEPVVGTCTAVLDPAGYYDPDFSDDEYFYDGVYVQGCTLYTPGNGEVHCTGTQGNGGGYASSTCQASAESSVDPGEYEVQGQAALYNFYDVLAIYGEGYGWGMCWNTDYPYDDPLDYAAVGATSCNNMAPDAQCWNIGYTLDWDCVNGTPFQDILEIESQDYEWGGQLGITISPTTVTVNPGATQQFTATVSNGTGATVKWSLSNGNGTISPTSGNAPTSTTTYTAPTSLTSASYVTLTATAENSSGVEVSAEANITLPIPTPTITSITPSSWTAGTSFAVNIAGTGFYPTTQVSITSPSWAISSTCTYVSAASLSCSVTIPANLAPVTASQGATISVCNGSVCSTYPASGTISIAPIVYTYTVTLAVPSPSLTYGYSTTITPTVTCKTSAGVPCASNVSNPQGAYFALLSGPGSIYPSGLQTSTTFTASTMVAYPSQNSAVQACAPLQTSSCVTTTISTAGVTVALNPATLANPLTGGQAQPFSASIQSPGTANQLTWTLTVSPSGAAPGTMVSATTAIAGAPTSGTSSNSYTAPNPISVLTTATLSACMTANTNICATPVAITLDPAPTFAVTATNPSQTTPLSLGHSMTYQVNVSPLYGFTGPVALSISGLPAGVTAQFSPASITTSGSSALTLTSAYSNSTFIGNSNITVSGASGSAANSTEIALATQPLQYKGYCGVQ